MNDAALSDTSTDGAAPTAETSIVDTILDLDDYLSGDVRRARKSVSICVRPELEARLDVLDHELDMLTDERGNPLEGDDEAMAGDGRTAGTVARERREVEQQYRGAMRRVEVEQWDEDEWRTWYKANERGLEDGDVRVFNELIVRSAVAPTISAEKILDMRKKMGHPQITKIANAAFHVNTVSGVDVPKSLISSHVLRRLQHAKS